MQRLHHFTTKTFTYLLIILFFIQCTEAGPRLLEIKPLDNYPSGSGLLFSNNQLYVMGDDASWLMITDSMFTRKDSIKIFGSDSIRIPKNIKPDIESIAMTRLNKKKLLLLTGSGSLSPYHDILVTIDPDTREQKQYSLDTFYRRLRNEGIRDVNIEASTAIPAYILLATRGNKSFKKNFLVFTSNRFWEKQDIASVRIIKTGMQSDTSAFTGISGMDYSYKTDQLFITASTENTMNSYDDGEIGKSFLLIINDISSKRRFDAINPDRIIDLEEIDVRFKGHKIESVSVIKSDSNKSELVLVSDDDKGGTVLFRLAL